MTVDEMKEQMWELFHIKWTRDVGTEGYNKKEWLLLESLILQLMKDTNGNS